MQTAIDIGSFGMIVGFMKNHKLYEIGDCAHDLLKKATAGPQYVADRLVDGASCLFVVPQFF